MNRPSPWRVRVSGPLQAYAAGFREELSALGYSARSAAGHLQLMAHLSRWLVEIGLAPGELTLPQVELFVQGRRGGSRVHRSLTLRGTQPLLDYLRRIGVVAAVEPAAASTGRDVVIQQFTGYLLGERGLAAPTIANYRAVAGRFLAGCRWESGTLVGVTSESVNSFVLGEATRRSGGSLNTVATGLRALLRFLCPLAGASHHLADAPVHPTPPGSTLPVDRTNSPRMTRPLGSTPTAPSRGFAATTSRSVSTPRDGTHCLTGTTDSATPSRHPPDRGPQYRGMPSHVPCRSSRPGSRRLHAGHRLARTRTPARLIPG